MTDPLTKKQSQIYIWTQIGELNDTSDDGGGGAGGYSESDGKSGGCYAASPLKAACGALTVTATTFPISVGGSGNVICS